MGFDFFNTAGALKSIRHLNMATFNLNLSAERLSSGYKINRASDGAARLLISENLRSQIRGSVVAQENVQQGISILAIADTALQTITESVHRMNEIAVAAQNGTTTSAQFSAYQQELTQLINTINGITSSTQYGTNVLLDGTISSGGSFNIQVGPNAGNHINIASAFGTATATALGLTFDPATLLSAGNASDLASDVNTMMGNLAQKLALLGGYQNRLQSADSILAISLENLSASEAKIRNTDVATETANLARYQILQQAASYVLAQAQQTPTLALSLLQ